MHWGLPKNWVSSGFEANKLQKLLSFPGAGDHGIFEKQPHAKCRTYPILSVASVFPVARSGTPSTVETWRCPGCLRSSKARPVHARSSCGIKTAAQCFQATARATAKDEVSDAPRPCTPTTSSARVPSVSDDDAQNWRCRCSGSPKFGARTKVVASRLCGLRVSTSAVWQADRLRGAAHPVVNIRTSEHHIPSRPRLSVRMFGSWGKKRANASSNCAAL